MANNERDPLRQINGGIAKSSSYTQRPIEERVANVEATTTTTASAYRGLRTDLTCASARADIRYRQVSRELGQLHQRVGESFEYLERLERNLRVFTVIEDWARSTELGYCCPAVRRLRHAINDVVPLAFALPEVMGNQDVVMEDGAGNNAGDNA